MTLTAIALTIAMPALYEGSTDAQLHAMGIQASADPVDALSRRDGKDPAGTHALPANRPTERAHQQAPPRVLVGESATYSAACADAWQAVRWYRSRTAEHRKTMGATGLPPVEQNASCRRLREGALYWQKTAKSNRAALARWRHYHYAWWDWMPAGWQRIGACETGYGKRPGRFDWNSGTYQGFAGFYHGSWDAFVGTADPKARPYPSEAHQATPRQQYEVALAIHRRYGLSGWGCRGAF